MKYQAVLAARKVGGDGLRKKCGMTVKKLPDSDKRDILKLYRQTGETTSTLAERYGVSNSTISRLLKSTLPEEEYEVLISSKRAARTSHPDAVQMPLLSPESDVEVASSLAASSSPIADDAATRLQQRSSAASPPEEAPAKVEELLQLLDIPTSTTALTTASSLNQDVLSKQGNQPERLDPQPVKIAPPLPRLLNEDALSKQGSKPEGLDRPVVIGSRQSSLDEETEAQATAVAQMLGEDLLDESDELMDLDDEDIEDLDEDDSDEELFPVRRPMPSATLVQVLPLSEATLPKTCYLVIDRASELITRPLRDFGDLGQIPTQEVQEKTLPVFDNHRVARRFSTKRDRVIKIPDSRLLQKTRSHLQAKGITRLLVDGQVYSLSK